MPFKIVRNDITRVGGLWKLCISVHKGATGKIDGTDWMWNR